MANEPTGPYMSNSAGDIPGKLKLGNRVVILHILLKVAGIDPGYYRELVVAACEHEGQPVDVHVENGGTDRDRDATIFFRPDLQPGRGDIERDIDELLYRLAEGEILPTEDQAREQQKG